MWCCQAWQTSHWTVSSQTEALGIAARGHACLARGQTFLAMTLWTWHLAPRLLHPIWTWHRCTLNTLVPCRKPL